MYLLTESPAITLLIFQAERFSLGLEWLFADKKYVRKVEIATTVATTLLLVWRHQSGGEFGWGGTSVTH